MLKANKTKTGGGEVKARLSEALERKEPLFSPGRALAEPLLEETRPNLKLGQGSFSVSASDHHATGVPQTSIMPPMP